MQGVTLVYALGVIVVILITDLVTARLDPRIRLRSTAAVTPAVGLAEPEHEVTRRPSVRSRALHSPIFMAGTILTATIVALALLAPVIGRYSPVSQDLLHTLAGPSGAPLARNRRDRS